MNLTTGKLQHITQEIISWINEMMIRTGGSKAVIGISGGKDSTVVAALCARALGPENVFGVLMPDGEQNDISFAYEICEFLRIAHKEISIGPMTAAFLAALKAAEGSLFSEITTQTQLNLPPRVRMTLLYAVSQSIDGSRVINTSNLSEDWVGYATIYGDTAGAFSPLGALTSQEVVEIGKILDIPEKFIEKPPADGLTGKTDEQILGFTYSSLNQYIREGIIEDDLLKEKIDRMHALNRFKMEPIPIFQPDLPVKAK